MHPPPHKPERPPTRVGKPLATSPGARPGAGRDPGLALPGGTQAITQALAHCEPLTSLGQRMQASQARLTAVLPLLPPAMRSHVRAGPIDEAAWVLLADNQAVSAKLRQMLPALEAQLRLRGLGSPAVKVRILGRD